MTHERGLRTALHTLGIYTATDRCFTCKTRVVSDVGAYSSAPPIYCTPDKLYVRLATC